MAEENQVGGESPQEEQKKEKKKSTWTLEKCQRASRRFKSREEWAKGAPSSYKAACARGWDGECTKHMPNTQRKRA